MTFYEQLGKVYDDVFPENPAIVSFLAEGQEQGRRILDLACGTGTYACALARMGHTVTGIDLDSGMIARAKEKGRGLPATFLAGDMTVFDTLTGGENYDRIHCIGNSLPHLDSRKTVEAFCIKVHEHLAPGGSFIVQTVNFSRVLAGGMNSLPMIENTGKALRFVRSYEIDAAIRTVVFHGDLTIGGESWHDSVPLLALEKDEMESILQRAGFLSLQIFGGYNGAAFNDDSPALVIKAMK